MSVILIFRCCFVETDEVTVNIPEGRRPTNLFTDDGSRCLDLPPRCHDAFQDVFEMMVGATGELAHTGVILQEEDDDGAQTVA